MKYLEVTCTLRMEVADGCVLENEEEVGPTLRFEGRFYQPAIEWMINDHARGKNAFTSLGDDVPFQEATLIGVEDSMQFVTEEEYAARVPGWGRMKTT